MKRPSITVRLLAGLSCCAGCAHPAASLEQTLGKVSATASAPQDKDAQDKDAQKSPFRTASFRMHDSAADAAVESRPSAAFRMIESLRALPGLGKDATAESEPPLRMAFQPQTPATVPVDEVETPQTVATQLPPALPPAVIEPTTEEDAVAIEAEASQMAHASELTPIALQSALALVGGQHPAVGYARWRVQQAYADLDQAQVMWLPTIQTGFSFHRHDGNYQASNGTIVDVNRNSFQYGLGNGATGAGTTQRPGVVAQFHLVDAIFQPQIARKTAWASQHASRGVLNEQLLKAALAYLDLLQAHQDQSIVEQTRDRTADLAKLTSDFALSGQGLQADADRLQTELLRWESRLVSSREQVAVASARLTQTLSLAYGQTVVPSEPNVVPIDVVTPQDDVATMIATGLQNRPELHASQALVAAACHQHQRQKYAPFVPSVLLGFSSGEFGGGLGDDIDNLDGRYDFDAALTWQARNLGFGEAAARRKSAAQVQQSRFQVAQTMDQIAAEVSEYHSRVIYRGEVMRIAQQAIETAQNSFDRNLDRIREGQGLPLEVLQSATALAEAQREYLDAVVAYNKAQFQLQWALGWPVG